MEHNNSKEITEKTFLNRITQKTYGLPYEQQQEIARELFLLAQQMQLTPIAEGETVYKWKPTTEGFPTDKNQTYPALHIVEGVVKGVGIFYWGGISWSLNIDNKTSSIGEDYPISSVYWLEPIQIPKQLDTKNLLEWIEIREKDERYSKFFTDGWQKAFKAIKGKILSLLQENHD